MSFGGQPPFTVFYFTVPNSAAAEYVTLAYKLLRFTEDSYSLQQSSWIWWNWSADLRICVVSWQRCCLAYCPYKYPSKIQTKCPSYYTCHEISGHLPPSFLALEKLLGWLLAWQLHSSSWCRREADSLGCPCGVHQQLVLSGWHSGGQLSPGGWYWQMVQHQAEMSVPLIQHSGGKRQPI